MAKVKVLREGKSVEVTVEGKIEWSVTKASKETGLSRWSIYQWMKSGRIIFKEISGRKIITGFK